MRVYQRFSGGCAAYLPGMLFLVLVVTDVTRRGARAFMARLQVPLTPGPGLEQPCAMTDVVAKRIFSRLARVRICAQITADTRTWHTAA